MSSLLFQQNFPSIENLLFEMVGKSYFDQSHNLWVKTSTWLWDTGRWDDLERIGEKLKTLYFSANQKSCLASLLIERLSWLYFWKGKLDNAEYAVKEGIGYAKQVNSKYLEHFGMIRLGNIALAKNASSSALNFFEAALVFFEGQDNKPLVSDLHNFLAESYWQLGQDQLAITTFKKAYKLAQELKDYSQIAIVLTRLAAMAFLQKKFSKAEKLFSSSIKIEKRLERRVGGDLWNNIGLLLVYEENNNLDGIARIMKNIQKESKYLHIKLHQCRKYFIFLKKLEPFIRSSKSIAATSTSYV